MAWLERADIRVLNPRTVLRPGRLPTERRFAARRSYEERMFFLLLDPGTTSRMFPLCTVILGYMTAGRYSLIAAYVWTCCPQNSDMWTSIRNSAGSGCVLYDIPGRRRVRQGTGRKMHTELLVDRLRPEITKVLNKRPEAAGLHQLVGTRRL